MKKPAQAREVVTPRYQTEGSRKPGHTALTDKTHAHTHTRTRTCPHRHHRSAGLLDSPRLRGAGLIECTLLLLRGKRPLCAGGRGRFQGPVPPGQLSLLRSAPRRRACPCAGTGFAGDPAPGAHAGPESATQHSAGTCRSLWTRAQAGARRAASEGENDESFFCKTLILTFQKGGGPAPRARRARDERDGGRRRRELERAWRRQRGATERRKRAPEENQPVSRNFRSGRGL